MGHGDSGFFFVAPLFICTWVSAVVLFLRDYYLRKEFEEYMSQNHPKEFSEFRGNTLFLYLGKGVNMSIYYELMDKWLKATGDELIAHYKRRIKSRRHAIVWCIICGLFLTLSVAFLYNWTHYGTLGVPVASPVRRFHV